MSILLQDGVIYKLYKYKDENDLEKKFQQGILNAFSSYITIHNNVVNKNWETGITIGTDSAHIKIENNIATFNGLGFSGSYGISTTHSSYVDILDNIVLRNGLGGISVGLKSTEILVQGNMVKKNGGLDIVGSGIETIISTNVDIIDNYVAKNNGAGITIGIASRNIYVIGNNIINNSGGKTVIGIVVSGATEVWIYCNTIREHGLYDDSFTITYAGILLTNTSSNVKIYHNNYIENNKPINFGTNNQWDNGYPSGGNYWWDVGGFFIGPDPSMDTKSGPNQDIPGSDGIVDFFYPIEKFSKDNYPLMEQRNITRCVLAYGLLTYPNLMKIHMRICTKSLEHLNTKIVKIFDSGSQRTDESIMDTLQTINYETIGIVNSITSKLQDDYIFPRGDLSGDELINFNIDRSAEIRLKTVEIKLIQISDDLKDLLDDIPDQPDEKTAAALRALRDVAVGIVN